MIVDYFFEYLNDFISKIPTSVMIALATFFVGFVLGRLLRKASNRLKRIPEKPVRDRIPVKIVDKPRVDQNISSIPILTFKLGQMPSLVLLLQQNAVIARGTADEIFNKREVTVDHKPVDQNFAPKKAGDYKVYHKGKPRILIRLA